MSTPASSTNDDRGIPRSHFGGIEFGRSGRRHSRRAVSPTPRSPCCRRATAGTISPPAGASGARWPSGSASTSTAIPASSPTRRPSAPRSRENAEHQREKRALGRREVSSA